MSAEPQQATIEREAALERLPVVWSHNEWDPLEEAIVGTIDGAAIPPWHVSLQATMPPAAWPLFQERGGTRWPADELKRAAEELDGFAELLESEGVTVRRPDPVDHTREFGTPDWRSTGGPSAAFPRDVMLVVGDRMIEAAMGWRSYYFAIQPFRRIVTDYFRRGATWLAAPRPMLPDELFREDLDAADEPEFTSVIGEFEPLFDAGDFMRCGRDIVVQRSHVTNRTGVEWLRRLLGDEYALHEVSFDDPHPMHINATFLPLAPGKVLVNPERVDRVPPLFEGWDVLVAPESCLPAGHPLYMCSRWISLNVLMLDERRVVVEEQEMALIQSLRSWGFEPIPCPFRWVNTFGGAFHCATCDVRRRGALEDYFD
jgi:glycine amidinotransferase